MMRMRALLIGGVAALSLGLGGVVVAGGLQQSPPQDAQPADPIGDILRQTPPVEQAPAGAPAPNAPVVVAPQALPEIVIAAPPEDLEIAEAEAEVETAPAVKVEEPDTPVRRQRRRVAVIEAIDKVTAEKMRFEVEVGGRPVRFNKALVVSARACEVAAPGELVRDAIAYLDISVQPRPGLRAAEPRQVFRGWMFASTPAVSGLQHPLYDAWVIGCRA